MQQQLGNLLGFVGAGLQTETFASGLETTLSTFEKNLTSCAKQAFVGNPEENAGMKKLLEWWEVEYESPAVETKGEEVAIADGEVAEKDEGQVAKKNGESADANSESGHAAPTGDGETAITETVETRRTELANASPLKKCRSRIRTFGAEECENGWILPNLRTGAPAERCQTCERFFRLMNSVGPRAGKPIVQIRRGGEDLTEEVAEATGDEGDEKTHRKRVTWASWGDDERVAWRKEMGRD